MTTSSGLLVPKAIQEELLKLFQSWPITDDYVWPIGPLSAAAEHFSGKCHHLRLASSDCFESLPCPDCGTLVKI